MDKVYLNYNQVYNQTAKGLEAELAPLHVQGAWGSRGERVRVVGLVACCNYFSKKKKKSL